MIDCNKILLILFVFLAVNGFAQGGLEVPGNIQEAYRKGTRSPDGRPGKNYWQNNANYKLAITFNPADRSVSGIVDIQYFNNSPDTLNEIWFKLYPNIYKNGSIRMQKIDSADVSNGVQIQNIKVNGEDSIGLKPVIDGTNMTIPVKPLLPGQSIIFSITYSYILNKGSHIRTGEVEEGAYFIAYFSHG